MIALTTLLLALPTPTPAQDAQQDDPYIQITFLDVGQADAVVIRAPEGQTALIDAGRSNPLHLLSDMDIDEIDLLVATHPHADHIGGRSSSELCVKVRGSSSMLRSGCLGDLLGLEE